MFWKGKFNWRAVAIVMMVAGSLCLVGAGCWFFYSWHLVMTSTRATGRITELVERHGEGGAAYYPVYAYADRNGAQHTIHSGIGSYPPPHRVGDAVTVLYTPGAEDRARLYDWQVFWGIPWLLVFIGAVDLIAGLIFLRRSRPLGTVDAK